MFNRYQLTQSYLKQVLDYEPSTGIWVWKHNSGSATIGKLAGCYNPKGYLVIRIGSFGYEAQLLAWLYMTGVLPTYGLHVDHIDTNPANNRWGNLRLATHAQQQWNTGLSSRNTSGVKGVTWSRQMGKWLARVQVNNKRINLGYYETVEQARIATTLARETYHGQYANNG